MSDPLIPDREPDFDPAQDSAGPETLRRRLLAELGADDVPQTIRLDREPACLTGLSESGEDLSDRLDQSASPDPSSRPSSAPSPTNAPGSGKTGSAPVREGSSPKAAAVNTRPPYQLPDVGEELFGFRLCYELGRGAFARVFLAEQVDLAGRLVVLKVSAIEGSEPQTLAQLQHTHIVPIYSVHDYPEAGLRALCMPYFGGTSLSTLLKKLNESSPHPAQGEELIQALDAIVIRQDKAVFSPSTKLTLSLPNAQVPLHASQTPRSRLCGSSFVRSAVWIVARLAEGLEHAHQRGVLHRDIKPSNILIGADGQPMLLDFNLAHSSLTPRAHAMLGGTIAYMSPEHLRALSSSRRVLSCEIDERSDVYSLGLVLYEMLSGKSPFEQNGSYTALPMLVDAMAVERSGTTPSLRRLRSDIPWSLESIIRRSLAPNPEERYQRAEQLAEDLRRFLDDQPLQHAPEPSLVERGQKWLRRHPRLATAATVSAVASVVLLCVGLALAGVRIALAGAQHQLASTQVVKTQGAFETGTEHALFLLNPSDEFPDHLRLGLRVCQDTLNLYQILERDDWQQHPDWRGLAPRDQTRLAEDTRDLLLLLAGAQVRLDPGNKQVLTEALALLDRAEAVAELPACGAVWEDRAQYLEKLGDPKGAEKARKRAKKIKPTTLRDHYRLAMTFARAGQPAHAIQHLNEALRLNPRHYWSWMQRGLRNLELKQYALAASDFGACVGQWPHFFWGHFNRAYALAHCGNKAEAIQDYTLALKLDPQLKEAYFNRGLLNLELKQFRRALDDLQRCKELGKDDAVVDSGLGVALEGLQRPNEADQAFASAVPRSAVLPQEERHRLLWTYGFAVATRLPEKAREAFEEVLRDNPSDPQALYGCAMLLDRQGKADLALVFFNRALEVSPHLEEARRFRAVLLARQGQFQAAYQDINTCLGREKASPATEYAGACVAALRAQADPRTAEHATEQALALLKKAFSQGYGVEIARRDPDLDGIRNDPAFRQLLTTYQDTANP